MSSGLLTGPESGTVHHCVGLSQTWLCVWYYCSCPGHVQRAPEAWRQVKMPPRIFKCPQVGKGPAAPSPVSQPLKLFSLHDTLVENAHGAGRSPTVSAVATPALRPPGEQGDTLNMDPWFAFPMGSLCARDRDTVELTKLRLVRLSPHACRSCGVIVYRWEAFDISVARESPKDV